MTRDPDRPRLVAQEESLLPGDAVQDPPAQEPTRRDRGQVVNGSPAAARATKTAARGGAPAADEPDDETDAVPPVQRQPVKRAVRAAPDRPSRVAVRSSAAAAVARHSVERSALRLVAAYRRTDSATELLVEAISSALGDGLPVEDIRALLLVAGLDMAALPDDVVRVLR